MAACEKGFLDLLRHDWGQDKGAIEDRQHWVGIGVATSSSTPFVVLRSSYRLSFADADSSLFEVRAPPHPPCFCPCPFLRHLMLTVGCSHARCCNYDDGRATSFLPSMMF